MLIFLNLCLYRHEYRKHIYPIRGRQSNIIISENWTHFQQSLLRAKVSSYLKQREGVIRNSFRANIYMMTIGVLYVGTVKIRDNLWKSHENSLWVVPFSPYLSLILVIFFKLNLIVFLSHPAILFEFLYSSAEYS